MRDPFEAPQFEDELQSRWRECMANNVAAKSGYDAARSYGMDKEMCLKASVVYLAELNKRALAIITEAIMHGMPITEEVADVRNQIVGVRKGKGP